MLLERLAQRFLILHRYQKISLMVIFDILLLNISIFLSFFLRIGSIDISERNLIFFIIAPFFAIPFFFKFGLYKSLIRFIDMKTHWLVSQAVTAYSLLLGTIIFITGVSGIPRSVIPINLFLSIMVISGFRFFIQWMFNKYLNVNQSAKRKKILIYGAGMAGLQLVNALRYSSELKPIGFLDDNAKIHNKFISGLKVYNPNSISKLIKKEDISEILLAMPSVKGSKKNLIINQISDLNINVRTVPGVSELAQGRLKIDNLKPVSVDDLLGREIIPPISKLLKRNIENKVVLITGAGGSIGSEICRQVLKVKPKKIILVDHNEFSLYKIDQELNQIFPKARIFPILLSVLNSRKIGILFTKYKIQTVYHAAAYKHVPLLELNNSSAIENNIFGTFNCVNASIKHKVESFVLVSTDKAVRPTNLMGATKRFSEMILQAFSDKKNSITQFSIVRFGNVLDSSGSVIPLFHNQIKRGGPVTVTDPNIVRYFMTIPEAAQLVIQAGSMSQDMSVYILDMGNPVKIVDLAEKMIRLSGLSVKDVKNPDGDIEINFVGLRPGEKLFEELSIGGNIFKTQHERIYRTEEDRLPIEEIRKILSSLEKTLINNDIPLAKKILASCVEGYKVKKNKIDLLSE